jgi:hypothetical protein
VEAVDLDPEGIDDGFAILGNTHVPSQGVNSCIESLLQDFTPSTTISDHLSEKTLVPLKEFFASKGHRPSARMWTALTELALVLEAMAEGQCQPEIFLSSLDPGVGKTQTVVHFVRALMRSKAHQDVGVLLCMSRLKEIRSVVDEMALSPSDFAVLTADPDLNKLGTGNCRANEAHVLFTTQQMIERRGEGRHFAEMDDFHFRGRPRQVRIWDESILPGQTLTLNRDDLASLLKPLRPAHSKLAAAIEVVFNELDHVDDGAVYQLPDFPAEYSLDLNEVLGVLSCAQRDQATRDQQQAITALWFLAGKTAAVRRDGKFGNTMLDY